MCSLKLLFHCGSCANTRHLLSLGTSIETVANTLENIFRAIVWTRSNESRGTVTITQSRSIVSLLKCRRCYTTTGLERQIPDASSTSWFAAAHSTAPRCIASHRIILCFAKRQPVVQGKQPLIGPASQTDDIVHFLLRRRSSVLEICSASVTPGYFLGCLYSRPSDIGTLDLVTPKSNPTSSTAHPHGRSSSMSLARHKSHDYALVLGIFLY